MIMIFLYLNMIKNVSKILTYLKTCNSYTHRNNYLADMCKLGKCFIYICLYILNYEAVYFLLVQLCGFNLIVVKKVFM